MPIRGPNVLLNKIGGQQIHLLYLNRQGQRRCHCDPNIRVLSRLIAEMDESNRLKCAVCEEEYWRLCRFWQKRDELLQNPEQQGDEEDE